MNPLIQIWDKWLRWAERIHDDLTTTVDDRAMFGQFGELVRANASWIDAHEGGTFLDFVSRQYVRATVMGIRRHIKNKDDSLSMSGLVTDMSRHAKDVTRAFYDSRHPLQDDAYDWRTRTFATLSDDGTSLSSTIMERDLTSLAELTSNVETFGDKVIAHVDKAAWNNPVTFDEIFQSVDRLNELFCHYVILTGHHFPSLEATNLMNWKRIFSVPFVDPSNKALNPTGLRPAG
jgi:hypothetical protein